MYEQNSLQANWRRSSKKSRMRKKTVHKEILKTVHKEIENTAAEKSGRPPKAQALLPISSLDVSSIEKVSFFEDDEVGSFGNPLHSTALEDDFSPHQGPKATLKKVGTLVGKKGKGKKTKSARHVDEGQPSRKVPSQLPPTSSAPKGGQLGARRKSFGVKSGTRGLPRVSEGPESDEAAMRCQASSLSGKAIPPHFGKGSTSDSAGPSQSSTSGNEEHATQGQLPSSKNAAVARRGQLSSLSSEDLTEEDPSWHREQNEKSSGPHMGAKRKSVAGRQNLKAQKRKSSSGSSGDAGPSNEKKRRERDVKNPTDLDVVLDAFLEFASEYKVTVDLEPVRKAIDAVSNMFEDQVTELITNTKELSGVKRENIKVNSTINKKRARLVEIRSELITKEKQLRNMQREHDQLLERLTDLRKGTAFLSALRELQRNYSMHRQGHPTEEEVYGYSSAPALLLEARGVLGVEWQLKNINDNLQQALERANCQ
ncbi:hypothetical protein GJAV_G00163680 [Gymnothorax javanicus]|nr:hypothetical protein GJAV_G00163680 [Gymnothorax javanicus]